MRLPLTLGDYELLEQLGAGAFGTVYRARLKGSHGFSQEVAVKLVDNARIKSNPTLVVSLADEAHILARISHPNIVQVRQFEQFSHEVIGDVYGLVMELVRGSTIGGLLKKCRAAEVVLPLPATVSLLLEAADSLRYAHGLTTEDGAYLGLVHRDLKPENLLVDAEGHLRVLDFGIAWVTERLIESTATGLAKGSLLYMSPEQLRGKRLDARSDLYSLGLIAFEMIVGARFRPVQGSSPASAAANALKVTYEQRQPKLEHALRTPEVHGLSEQEAGEWQELLRLLLHEDLEQRTASASVLQEQLELLSAKWKPTEGKRFLRAIYLDQSAAPDPSLATLGDELSSIPPTVVEGNTGSDSYVPPTRAQVERGGVGATRAQEPTGAPRAKALPTIPLLIGLGAVALAVLWWVALGGSGGEALVEKGVISDKPIPALPQAPTGTRGDKSMGAVLGSKTSPLVLADALEEFLAPLGLSHDSSLEQATRQFGQPDETASVKGQNDGAQEGYASFLGGEVVVFHDPNSNKLLQVNIAMPRGGQMQLTKRAPGSGLLSLFEVTSSDLERLLGTPQVNPERSTFSYVLPDGGGTVTLQCYSGSLCSELRVAWR